MTENAFAQSLPPINLRRENPKRQLTREEKEYQKQLDNDYKATINKIPEQRANDPWAAFSTATDRSRPKEAEISEALAIRRGARRIAANIARCPELLSKVWSLPAALIVVRDGDIGGHPDRAANFMAARGCPLSALNCHSVKSQSLPLPRPRDFSMTNTEE